MDEKLPYSFLRSFRELREQLMVSGEQLAILFANRADSLDAVHPPGQHSAERLPHAVLGHVVYTLHKRELVAKSWVVNLSCVGAVTPAIARYETSTWAGGGSGVERTRGMRG